MKALVLILTLVIGFSAKGQDSAFFRRIDSVVLKTDSIKSKVTVDTLKNGLLHDGGYTSDLFLMKQDGVVQKILVMNTAINYSEKFIFEKGKPVFAEFLRRDGSKWTFYLVGTYSYFKDGKRIGKGSSNYWYGMADTYLGLFKAKSDRSGS